VNDARFGSKEVKEVAKRLIVEAGIAEGIKSASIHEFYMARVRGEYKDITVPAYNVRTGPAFDTFG